MEERHSGLKAHMGTLSIFQTDLAASAATCLFSAREKHSLLFTYSYMCLAFKHVNSAHRPSVLSKGRERKGIPQGFNGLY